MPSLPHPTPVNVTGFLELWQYANAATDGLFGPLLLLMVWSVSFLAFSRYPAHKSLTGASFLTFVTSVFLWAAGIVGSAPVIACVLAVIGSVIYLFQQKDSPGY